MRIKQLWSFCNIPAKASLVWSRITFSRLTTAYFLLAVIHCIIQVILELEAFSINATARNRLWSLVQQADESQEDNGFAILANDLRICYSVPDNINTDSCQVIWRGNNQSGPSYGMALASLAASVASTSTASASVSTPSSTLAASVTSVLPSSVLQEPSSMASTALPTLSPSKPILTPVSSFASSVTFVTSPTPNAQGGTTAVVIANPDNGDDDEEVVDLERGLQRRFFASKRTLKVSPTVVNGSTVGVDVYGFASDPQQSTNNTDTSLVQLNSTCIKTLIWPVQRLSDTKREDITLIGFQIWVLGMSIAALLNESIPHISAALVTHFLVTIWTIFQVFETEQFRQNFARLTTNGACHPHNLLGNYWEQRKNAEIPSAVLNSVALLISAFLTYKLMKIYGWQTFKRVGASLTINRVYKLVLSLSIAIQLALFFIVSAAALWIDQLYNGAVGRLASLAPVYRGGIIVQFCLLIPWLSLGWFAVRREMRKLALVFLVLSLTFIGLWAALFKSTAFRWTFVTWPFFAVMAVTSGSLIVITFILGLACRFNFGKGLPRYLNAQEPLDGNDFAPVYPEKGEFLDDPEKVDFPSSHGRPIPTFSVTFGRGSDVPRPAQMHFGPSRASGNVSYSHGRSVSRSTSSSSSDSTKLDALARTDTRGSQMTHKSGSSTSSSRTDVMGKRWVIE